MAKEPGKGYKHVCATDRVDNFISSEMPFEGQNQH